MARPSRTNEQVQALTEFTRLLKASYSAGHRGDGKAWPAGQGWTVELLATAIDQPPGTIRGWVSDVKRPDGKLTLPRDIRKLLDVLYGHDSKHESRRRSMQRAWSNAGGKETGPVDTQASVRGIVLSEHAEVAVLVVNRPIMDDNKGDKISIPFMLSFRRAHIPELTLEVSGKRETVSLHIAVRRPLFSVRSKFWQPRHDTIVRQTRHKHIDRTDLLRDARWITGPKDEAGWIAGEPFEDAPMLGMEHTGLDGNDPVIVAVHVPRTGGFHVSLDGTEAPTLTQEDVVNAIFAEAHRIDANGNLEIASKQVTPQAVERDQ